MASTRLYIYLLVLLWLASAPGFPPLLYFTDSTYSCCFRWFLRQVSPRWYILRYLRCLGWFLCRASSRWYISLTLLTLVALDGFCARFPLVGISYSPLTLVALDGFCTRFLPVKISYSTYSCCSGWFLRQVSTRWYILLYSLVLLWMASAPGFLSLVYLTLLTLVALDGFCARFPTVGISYPTYSCFLEWFLRQVSSRWYILLSTYSCCSGWLLRQVSARWYSLLSTYSCCSGWFLR